MSQFAILPHTNHPLILDQIRGIDVADYTDAALLANVGALLFLSLPDLNWLGFYLTAGTDLVLGPFQGKPACVRIPVGKGVCGTAAALRKTVVVPDVHEFPGHIACDAASRSEIVVPLIRAGELLGVLDLDSPELNRFDAVDQAALERMAVIIVEASS